MSESDGPASIDTTERCRCGHSLGSHFFGSECQAMVCSCRQFGRPLDRSNVAGDADGWFVHLGDFHAGLSLYHCMRCASVVERTARPGHDRWHDDG